MSATVDSAPTRNPLRGAAEIPRLVKLSHTLFALPWALAGLFLGSRGWPSPGTLLGVLLAMVGARTAAMTFNRLVDRRLDATNPRTRERPSVTGAVSPAMMVLVLALAAALFVAASYALNPLCGALSWVALVVVLGYSFCKRFTSLSHWVLGVALGLAPMGGYLAARGSFDQGSLAALALGISVVLWTAGFDIFYACQDVDHDRSEGLHSIPAKLGVQGALGVARIMHMLVPPVLLGAWWLGELGYFFLGAWLVIAVLLVYEHRIVRPDNLERVGVAFFNVNVIISLTVMVGVAGDLIVGASA